jgi:hypothetical protein
MGVDARTSGRVEAVERGRTNWGPLLHRFELPDLENKTRNQNGTKFTRNSKTHRFKFVGELNEKSKRYNQHPLFRKRTGSRSRTYAL